MNSGLVFMGTPQIAADVLQALLDAGAQIDLAVCQPDKKAGRKGKLHACEVKQLALEHQIPVFQPQSLKKDFQPVLDVRPDLIITCAYGQIVPQEVLDAPAHGCVNLHGSILPAYRGAAPIQRAIMDGLKTTGMSLMKMEAGLDTGPVAAVEPVEIADDETSTTLFEKMGKAAGKLIVTHLNELLNDEIPFVSQSEEGSTYAKKISKEEEHLDLSLDDAALYCKIRSLAKEPGGYVIADGRKLKLLGVRYEKGETPGIGVFAKEGRRQMVMGGHEGRFFLDEVQLEGKNAMLSKDFVNGAGRALIGRKAGE